MFPADLDPAEFWITIAALTLGIALAVTMAIVERRPRKSISPPLVPTTPVMFLGTVIGVLALLHLLGFLGIQTGR